MQIEPVTSVEACSNLKIRKGRSDDFFDTSTQEVLSPFDDFVRVTDGGVRACTLAINVHDMAVYESGRPVNPLLTTVHWNRSLPPTVSANLSQLFVHPDGTATMIDVPVFRAARLAAALR